MPAHERNPVSVVTGGAGFLGSHLTDRLLAEGHRVIAIDNFITGSDANIGHLAGNENYRFIKHNVSNFIFLPEEKIDYVFHFSSPAWPRTKRPRSFWHRPRNATATRWCIRKRKITGAMSTRSDRAAFTMKRSV